MSDERTPEDQVRYFLVHGDKDRVVTYGRALNIFNDIVTERDSLTTRLAEATEDAEAKRLIAAQSEETITRLANENNRLRQRVRLATHAAEQVKNPEFVKALDEAGVEYVGQLVERIAEVERERDEARANERLTLQRLTQPTGGSILERWNADAAASYEREQTLREQLTRAREAWTAFADHVQQRHACDWGYTERPQALATINREGETG